MTELTTRANHSPGMSFLEVMVMLMIIGIMGAVVAPNLSYFSSKKEKTEFVTNFEELIHRTRQEALLSGKVHQLFFDFQKHLVIPKVYSDSVVDESKHQRFVPAAIAPMELDIRFELQNFYIQGKDEVRSGTVRNNAWFYIMPDGSSQDVVINFVYGDEEEKQLGIKVNPFYARVFIYDTFQIP
jgi:type II secretory pathway pseudopilin PulG